MAKVIFETELVKLLSRYDRISHRELASELSRIIPKDCRMNTLGESVTAALGDRELTESDAAKIAALEAAFEMPDRTV